MHTKDLKKKIKYLFAPTANTTPLGITSSPALSSLFNQSWDLAQFFNAFFKTALIAGAMLAVLRLGYAGFMYMTTDSFGSKGKAKDIIQDTVIGLLLLMSIWIILNQINPNLLNLNILQGVRPPGQEVNTSGGGGGAMPGGGFGCGAGTAWDGTQCASSINTNTCAGFGGSADPSYGSGACIFGAGRGSPPVGSWCSGNVCFGTRDACNTGRSSQNIIMRNISNPCTQK